MLIRYNNGHFNGMQISAFASEPSEPRQIRKEATVIGVSCAEMSLVCGHPLFDAFKAVNATP